MDLLLNHYQHVLHNPNHASGLLENDRARMVDLPGPLDDTFTFPESMSPAVMDRRDIKISFVRLFQFWDTPLHIAAAHDRVSATKALLASGADVDCTATQACSCRRDQMPTSLTYPRGANLVAAYTPLHVAICMGSYRVAKVLVASGADRMAKIFRSNGNRDWLRENALHRALSWRNKDLQGNDLWFDYNFIEFLLGQGYAARLEDRNFEDMTPLQIACQSIYEPAQMAVVKLLLRHGADPDSQSLSPPGLDIFRIPFHHIRPNDRATPALWATRQGHFQVAKLLLDHGADAKARSSTMHETMLFAVCTARNMRVPPADASIRQLRMELLDTLLASDTAKDLNTFYENDRNLLMGLIRARIFEDLPTRYFGAWESKLFAAGADIMAGVDMGKVTPFELMITDVLSCRFNRITGMVTARLHLHNICGKVLIVLRESGIARHRYRPTAMLNRFWGYLKRNSWHLGIAVYMLPALLRAGFSPAEVDRHGDTAMTSFLQHLLDNPEWAAHDSTALYSESQAWILPMIMALLQEHDAALQKRNDLGFTAFEYLDQIFNYGGEEEALIRLRRVMYRSVSVSLDDHGLKCLRFHPMALIGRISGDDTILKLRDNPARWLACEHFCKGGFCSSFGANWQCGCKATPFQPLARCEGGCC